MRDTLHNNDPTDPFVLDEHALWLLDANYMTLNNMFHGDRTPGMWQPGVTGIARCRLPILTPTTDDHIFLKKKVGLHIFVAKSMSRPQTLRIWLALDVTIPTSFWLSRNYFPGKMRAIAVRRVRYFPKNPTRATVRVLLSNDLPSNLPKSPTKEMTYPGTYPNRLLGK